MADEPGIDLALLAAPDPVHRRASYYRKSLGREPRRRTRKRVPVGVEQHLVGLQEIGTDDEGPAVTELEVGNLQLGPLAADDRPVLGPVKLEGFMSARIVRKLKANLAATFPSLSQVNIVEAWAGMVETSPDVVPIIGPEATLPGFFHATGFSGHGFGFGPGAGKVIAEMLVGDTPSHDLSSFRLERFFDGSPIRPQAAF